MKINFYKTRKKIQIFYGTENLQTSHFLLEFFCTFHKLLSDFVNYDAPLGKNSASQAAINRPTDNNKPKLPLKAVN